jgi:hypothetical protein
MLILAVGSAALTGCALRDPRDDYAYGRGADGLWDTSFDIIDWNFPTSVNQGPIVRPERLRLERTAIGVTWATRNPIPINEPQPGAAQMPGQDNDAPAQPQAPASPGSDDGAGATPSAAGPAAGAGARESRGLR